MTVPVQRAESFTCRECLQTKEIRERAKGRREWCKGCAATYRREWRERTSPAPPSLLRVERDLARTVAVALEQECAVLRAALEALGADPDVLLAEQVTA